MAGRFKFVALGVIVLGLALGVSFGLGVAYGKGDEPAGQGGLTQQQLNQMLGIGTGGVSGGPGGGGAGGGAGAGGGGGGQQGAGANQASAQASARSTMGRITAVQGQTVTIEIRPGLTQRLNIAPSTVVNKTQTGAPADLKEGTSVLVSGTRKDDGSFDAATINLVPPELVQALSPAAPATTAPSPQGQAPAPAAPNAPAPAAPGR